MIDACELIVYGDPQPQGSKTAMIVGERIKVRGRLAVIEPRAVIVEGRNLRRKDGTMSDGRQRFKAWRTAVESAARIWAQDNRVDPWDGPLKIDLAFYLRRPVSMSKHVLYPATGFDVDKLVRNALDALTGIVMTNDARVIALTAQKLFTFDTQPPRCEIVVVRLPATLHELQQLQLGTS